MYLTLCRHATGFALAWNRRTRTRIPKLVQSPCAAHRSAPARHRTRTDARNPTQATNFSGNCRPRPRPPAVFMRNPAAAPGSSSSALFPTSPPIPRSARRTPGNSSATRAAHQDEPRGRGARAQQAQRRPGPQQVKYAGAPPAAFLPTKNSSGTRQLRHPRIVPHHGVARMLRLRRPRAGAGGPHPRGEHLLSLPPPSPCFLASDLAPCSTVPLTVSPLIAGPRGFARLIGASLAIDTGYGRVQQGSQPEQGQPRRRRLPDGGEKNFMGSGVIE